jgi:hypothetical protein
MPSEIWRTLKKTEWEATGTTATWGCLLLFAWSVLRSGESGPELPQMHVLGEVMVFAGWSCIAAAVVIAYRAIRRSHSMNLNA